jgi:hypothetical protein
MLGVFGVLGNLFFIAPNTQLCVPDLGAVLFPRTDLKTEKGHCVEIADTLMNHNNG